MFPDLINSALKERLAIALLESKQPRKAFELLWKEYLSEPSRLSTINNLALAAHRLGKVEEARDLLESATAMWKRQVLHAGRVDAAPPLNLAGLLFEIHKPTGALKVLQEALALSRAHRFPTKEHDALSLKYLEALFQVNRDDEAFSTGKALLQAASPTSEFYAKMGIALLYHYALTNTQADDAIQVCKDMLSHLRDGTVSEKALRRQIANNVVFLFLRAGHFDDARDSLQFLNPYLLSDPYATATFGLYEIQRGRLEKGKELYLAVARLSDQKLLRRHIIQRMNLEIGRHYLARSDFSKARNRLRKAAKAKDGQEEPAREAADLLSLAQRPAS